MYDSAIPSTDQASTYLEWAIELVRDFMPGSYEDVFKPLVGENLSAYKEGVEFYEESAINYDYVPVITVLVLLIVTFDYFYDAIVERLPSTLRNTVLDHRAYPFTAKIYPSLIALLLLPYTIYIFLYHFIELNGFSSLFPPSHYLFGVCILINLISIFYFSFRYIRAGFDMGGWRTSTSFLAIFFTCFFTWYEIVPVVHGKKYLFPYKVLYKCFATRLFTYVCVFDLTIVIYMAVAITILLFKKYHLKFSNKKPSKAK